MLLDSSNRDLLVLFVNDLMVGLACRKYYCVQAASFLLQGMRRKR